MSGTRFTDRQRLAAVTLAGLGVLMIAVCFFKPGASAWLPPCPFHALTGLYCPGCGSTRMLYLLVHGHPLLAFRENAFVMLLLPVLVVKLVVDLAGMRDVIGVRYTRPLGIGIAAAIVLFTVARNLPWEPFRVLAPRDLVSVRGRLNLRVESCELRVWSSDSGAAPVEG